MGSTNTVFGFDIVAPFSLRTARTGDNGDRLFVEMAEVEGFESGPPIISWQPGPDNPLDATLRERPTGGYVLDIIDAGTYLVEPLSSRITIPVMPDIPLREIRLLGLPLLLCFLARGDISLHGAAVMGPTGAIVLAAPGRHGKTSLAAMLTRLGYRLLTEDLCCIRTGKESLLFPGPASLRVRPDMAGHVLPLDGMAEIGTIDDRVVLAATDPGDGQPVPVAGIVLLKGFDDEVSLVELDPVDSLSDLWLLSFHLPTEADRAHKFTQLVDLVGSVRMWELTQANDRGAVGLSAEKLMAAVV
jgi:hypothetical protein